MTEQKQRELIKYCMKYKQGGRINKAVKTVGWSLNHCRGSIEDAKFAKLLLEILIGDVK